uniref:Secreted protein n=1 Tax=Panagrellus redivivus TaxID=6233 RepID=A0A7E4VIT8_PANRE
MIAFVFLVSLVTLVNAGPVQVRIETDNQNDFNIGSGPRQTFELTEEYRPLSVAFNPRMPSRAVPKSIAVPPPKIPQRVPLPPSEPSNVHIINVNGTDVRIVDTPIDGLARNPKDSSVLPVGSRWSDWSRWGSCQDGLRSRTRTCILVNNVPCLGASAETQKCYSFTHSDIPFAKDPLVIEKEILGMDPVDVVA